MSTELQIWIRWLQNYQRFEGKFSVIIAQELERVLQRAERRLCDQQAEIEILRTNGGKADAGKDRV